jgi:superfamily II DNA or RNA helicase
VPLPPDDDALEALLEEMYDSGSVARGRAYAAERRVRLLESPPGTLKAVCRGSGDASYAVWIRWNATRSFADLIDTCSCPLGGGCKHCVATLLTARSAGGGDRSLRPASEWRRLLSDLGTDAEEPAGAALALQVAVQRPKPNRYAPNAEPSVAIRPMRRGKTGKWVKTGAAWRDLCTTYSYRTEHVDPVHRAAVRALATSSRVDLTYASTQAVTLAQMGPAVWRQVQGAVDVGIELIGAQPGDVVELAPAPAAASIDLTADEAGDLTMSTGFVLDGAPLVLHDGRGGLIGTPPHGLWFAEEGRLLLVPLAGPLHPTVARLAGTHPLSIPAQDVDELLDVYQPILARHAGVASSDASVTITTSELEGLVLHVERTAVDAATLRWAARYRRGDRTTDHHLDGPQSETRDRAAEAAALAALELPTDLLPELADAEGAPHDLAVSGPAAVTLLTEVVPRLRATEGVQVEVTGDQPTLHEATDAPHIALTVTDAHDHQDGHDWFDLGIEVSVGGEEIDFVSLFTALHRDDEVLVLPSGSWLRLDHPDLTRLRGLIDEARGLAEPAGNGVARVNPFQTSWWDELRELGVVAEQSRRWEERVGQMAALAAPEPVALPAGLEASLRPYQQEGFDWLAFLHRNGLGGVLADDMGLGKTVQCLALMLHVLEEHPDARFLVVAPTSVVENWAREAARFAPGIDVRTIRETAGRRGTSLDEAIDGAALVVTSYALFRIEQDTYAQHDWELLLLDEAQFVKNHQGKTYQCVRRLDAATKIAITGTPLENTLMDLWSLLSITAPGLYPDPKRFEATYRKPIESGDAPELLTVLRRRIAPLLRRRTKDAVLQDLPPKTEQTIEVELSSRHARIYATQLQRQRQKVLGLVGDVQKHRFEILKSLTILRQLALDPGLVDEGHTEVGSAKLDRLVDDLTQVVAEGHRALVFSQFTRYLARVRARLDVAGIEHSYLDGRTRKREQAISRFKDGDAPVFVISLKAGGFGLNLTEADYCFVLDPWWNPASETQAVDRAHRIGQQNPVMVYRYVSVDTIEEKVMELKARKADLFTSVMDAEGALAGALTQADVQGLFDLA